MLEIRQSSAFADWLRGMRDIQARAIIARRIERMALGNFGDHKSVGEGVSELRITVGPGYRVYYTQKGRQVVILLCGGDKGSHRRDIAKAKLLAGQLE
jgi:putative addiction module killer protein